MILENSHDFELIDSDECEGLLQIFSSKGERIIL